ncbi:hypothetical protein ACS0TY_023247 [Phlomoides rotata]
MFSTLLQNPLKPLRHASHPSPPKPLQNPSAALPPKAVCPKHSETALLRNHSETCLFVPTLLPKHSRVTTAILVLV